MDRSPRNGAAKCQNSSDPLFPRRDAHAQCPRALRSRLGSASSALIRSSRSASAAVISVASNRCGICCGQFALATTPTKVLAAGSMWRRLNAGPQSRDESAYATGIGFGPNHRAPRASRYRRSHRKLSGCGGLSTPHSNRCERLWKFDFRSPRSEKSGFSNPPRAYAQHIRRRCQTGCGLPANTKRAESSQERREVPRSDGPSRKGRRRTARCRNLSR